MNYARIIDLTVDCKKVTAIFFRGLLKGYYEIGDNYDGLALYKLINLLIATSIR